MFGLYPQFPCNFADGPACLSAQQIAHCLALESAGQGKRLNRAVALPENGFDVLSMHHILRHG